MGNSFSLMCACALKVGYGACTQIRLARVAEKASAAAHLYPGLGVKDHDLLVTACAGNHGAAGAERAAQHAGVLVCGDDLIRGWVPEERRAVSMTRCI